MVCQVWSDKCSVGSVSSSACLDYAFTIETPSYNFREGLSDKSDGGQFATPFRDDSFWFGTVQGVYKSKTYYNRIQLAESKN